MFNDWLRALAPSLASDVVLFGLVGFLAVWAGLSLLRLWAAGRHVGSAFRQARGSLGDDADPVAFAEGFECAADALEKQRLLGSSWGAFRHSLIVPDDPGRPVFATASPGTFFDLTALFRSAGADLRYHAAMPGLLVGAGLLVTFLGLAAALASAADVVAEGVQPAERNRALRDLLGAASVKFVTSIAGLLLSIAYALVRKSVLRGAERAREEFLHALRERLPLRTQSALQAEANRTLERQYADIQRIGSDFFVNLGSTLETKFNSGLETHLGPLAEAIGKLEQRLAGQNEDAVGTMLQTFLEKLEGAVGDSMRATSQTLAMLGEKLGGMQEAMDAAAERMASASQEMAARLGQGAEAALSGITAQMSALVAAMSAAADEARRHNASAGDEMTRRMAETAATLTAAVESFRSAMEVQTAEGVSRLAGPIEALLSQLRDFAEAQRRTGSEALGALTDTLGQAARSLEATADRIAATLGAGASDASQRLIAATEAMRDDLRQVLDRFGATIGESGRSLAKGAEDGGETLRQAAGSLAARLDEAAGRIRESADAAAGALREGGHAAAADLTAAAQGIGRDSAGLAGRIEELGRIAGRLAEQGAALGQGLEGATGPLTAASQTLRDAAAGVAQALAPWQQVARSIQGAVDGLNTAAAAMDSSGQRGAELAGRLDEATKRFDGLDKTLAGTLRELSQALTGYQLQVSEFVKGMDEGLRKSVHGLQAIAKSLEDSVEELSGPRSRGR